MGRLVGASLAGGMALLLSPPAAAQQPAPPAGTTSEIVVTGPRNLDEQIRDFVGALTPAPIRGQLGRFEWAVCPVALGLAPSQKEAVERRLRAVAGAVGLRVGRPGCAANMLVIVTGDKRAFLAGLRARHGQYLGDMTAADYRRLLDQPGPAAAWHQVGRLAADGTALTSGFGAGIPINRSFTAPSRVTAGARPHFEAAAVVIEARALAGLTTTQVADYAAMRLLARTEPSRLGGTAPATILNVLEAPMGMEVPLTLTQWDLGFLRGLYNSPNNIYAPAQRGQIGRGIARELERPRAPGS